VPQVDGSSFVANSLDQFGIPFYVYYLTLLSCGVYHMTYGLTQLLAKYTSIGRISRRAQPVAAVGLIALAYAGLLGIGGHWGSPVDRSRYAEYRALF
jgi:succinate dehydrogenase/fumarate reductase cytochrome b subunit